MIDSGIIYAQAVLYPSKVEMLILCSENRIYKNKLYVSCPASDVSFWKLKTSIKVFHLMLLFGYIYVFLIKFFILKEL